MAETNFFKDLYSVDMSAKVKQKNGLSYAPWAASWAEVKKRFPNAKYELLEQVIQTDTEGNTIRSRPWFDDGRTGWVKVKVTINDVSQTESLPILDYKNKPIAAEAITSSDANKSFKRCLAKACACCGGIGLYLYEGEDIPEATANVQKYIQEIDKIYIAKKKSGFTDDDLLKVIEEIIGAETGGNYRSCDNEDQLKSVKTKLMGLRKIPAKKG